MGRIDKHDSLHCIVYGEIFFDNDKRIAEIRRVVGVLEVFPSMVDDFINLIDDKQGYEWIILNVNGTWSYSLWNEENLTNWDVYNRLVTPWGMNGKINLKH